MLQSRYDGLLASRGGRLRPSSPPLLPARSSPPSLLPVPALVLLYPSSDLLISPSWQKTLQRFDLCFFSSLSLFSSAFVSHCAGGKEEAGALSPSREDRRRSRTFPSQCWRDAKFAHWLVYDHVDDLEQDGITQSEFNAKVLLLERTLSFGKRIFYSQTCWEAVQQKWLSVQTS